MGGHKQGTKRAYNKTSCNMGGGAGVMDQSPKLYMVGGIVGAGGLDWAKIVPCKPFQGLGERGEGIRMCLCLGAFL